MNVLITIDPVWSYNLIGGIKGFVDIDHNTQSHIFEMVGLYIKLQHNFVYTHLKDDFNTGYEYILMSLQRYPIDTSYFEHYFKNLYRTYQLSFNALKGIIKKVTIITNDHGDINAFIFDVEESKPYIQSVLNPILQS